jgi:hypothetical protein
LRVDLVRHEAFQLALLNFISRPINYEIIAAELNNQLHFEIKLPESKYGHIYKASPDKNSRKLPQSDSNIRLPDPTHLKKIYHNTS